MAGTQGLHGRSGRSGAYRHLETGRWRSSPWDAAAALAVTASAAVTRTTQATPPYEHRKRTPAQTSSAIPPARPTVPTNAYTANLLHHRCTHSLGRGGRRCWPPTRGRNAATEHALAWSMAARSAGCKASSTCGCPINTERHGMHLRLVWLVPACADLDVRGRGVTARVPVGIGRRQASTLGADPVVAEMCAKQEARVRSPRITSNTGRMKHECSEGTNPMQNDNDARVRVPTRGEGPPTSAEVRPSHLSRAI